MRYLVTGGCGFIGSHLCDRLLEDGHSLIVLDDLSTGKVENVPDGVEIVEGSICDKSQFETLVPKVDGVFHLAAIASVERSRLEWEYTHEVNLGGMVNLLAAITRLEKKIPVVYASSAAVFGDNDQMPIDELADTFPLTAYGADKLGCEQHAKVGAVVHGIPSVGLRFFNVYGPRQDPSSPYSGVISIFADRIKANQGIAFFGDGLQTRDFVYVGDVVSALYASMQVLESQKASNEVVGVCTGKETSLLELATTLEVITGNVVEKTHAEERMGDIRKSLGNPAKMNKLLQVVAETPLEDGLRLTLS